MQNEEIMLYNDAKDFILEELKQKLSIDLFYHNIEHTLDVLGAATRYARMEDVSEHEQLLIQTAALFHDSGMLRTYKNHEDKSVEIIKEVLPDFKYTKDDIEVISGMIMTTKLPQSASNLLEKILCDADLDYLGRTDFFMIAMSLQHEWNILKFKETDLLQWYELQVDFLQNHVFYTQSAKTLRNDQKQKNLDQVLALLNHK